MEQQTAPCLHVYKNGSTISAIQQLPISREERIRTDSFCTVCTSLFALTIFIISIFSLNRQNLQRMSYPTDQQQRHCTLDNPNYNYLYFSSLDDPSKRLCVASCPNGNETKLDCWPTSSLSCAANSQPNFQVNIYSSQAWKSSLGLYCLPTDSIFAEKVLVNAHLHQMFQFVSAVKSILLSNLAAIVLGLFGLILFSYFPGVMSYMMILLGGVGCFVSVIVLLIVDSELLAVYKSMVIIFSIVFCFLGILLFSACIWRRQDINLSIEFLEKAVICFKQYPPLAFVSLSFIVFFIGLSILCGFEIIACWSQDNLILNPTSVYEQPKGNFSIVMTVIIVIQFIWGLCFLKETLNFLLTGSSVNWYFRKQHSLKFAIDNLFTFHWGSIAAGSFILYLLYPFDLFCDFIKPSNPDSPFNCIFCESVLDLSRTQIMTFINITGNPYCNSARRCENISYHSNYMIGNQSANRFVKIGTHISLSFIATVIAFADMKNSGSVSALALILSFIINLFILSFFVCLLTDISEAILFSTLIENYLKRKDQIKQKELFQRKSMLEQGYQILPTQK